MKVMFTLLAIVGIIAGLANLHYTFVAQGEGGPPFLLTHPLMMAALVYLIFEHLFPAFVFRGPRERPAETVQIVSTSGQPVAATLTGGRIGWLSLRGPLLRATAYPDGIIFKPLFLTRFAVASNEITAVTYQSSWLKYGLEIAHRSPQIVSPIIVCCSKDDPLVAAARQMAPPPHDHPA